MKTAIYLIGFSFFLESLLFAQKKSKIQFSNIEQIGLITANKPNNINLETINGVKYKSWLAGIGVGIDWQKVRSMLLFLDIRKVLGKKNKWFVYADVGTNIWFEKNTNGNFFTTVGPYENTYFTEAGIGYLFRLYKKNIYLSMGYGYKNIQYHEKYTYYINTQLPNDYYSYRINTYINRLALKVGIQF